MRRLVVVALLLLAASAQADQGWRDNQDGKNFACYDVSSFSANNLTAGGTCVAVPGTGQIVIGGAAPIATWSLTGAMVYAVDGINGSDSNACGAFSVDQTAANIAAATAAAGAVACQTYTGLATKIPPLLNKRTYYGVAAKGTYADNMSALNGISGGVQIWRGTGTDGTAGATAFSGSTADLIDEGAQTCAGANAAGYHPTVNGTSDHVQLAKVGGGSPAFGAEPAKPLYCRSRGDVSTGSTGLRNAVNSVIQVIGSDTIVLDTAVTFTTTDTIYLEEPGVIQTGTISLSGNNGTTVISGVQTTAGINTNQGSYFFSFVESGTSWSSSFDRTINFFTAVDFPTTPVIGPSRVGTSVNITGGSVSAGAAALGVATSLSVSNPTQFLFADLDVVGTNALFAGGAGGPSNSLGGGSATTFGGTNASTPVRVLGSITLNGARISTRNISLPNSTSAFGVSVNGTVDLTIGAVISGGTKTNAGWDFSNSTQSRIYWDGGFVPTVTGSRGDMYFGNYSIPDNQNIYLDYVGVVDIPGTLVLPNGTSIVQNLTGAAGGIYTATTTYNRGDPPGSSSGPTITPRSLVVFNFTDGSGVSLAQADTAAHMQGALGFAVSTMPVGGGGFVIAHGSALNGILESGGCPGHSVTNGWQEVYVSAATAGAYTCTKPPIARVLGWTSAENFISFFPDNDFMPISQLYVGGSLQNTEKGINFSSEFGYTDNPGAFRGDVSINSIAVTKIVGPTGGGTQCLQTSNTGVITGIGTACGTGSGGVTSVTGTAQRISATPTTGAVVVDTIGGISSGAVSGGNQSLGALTSGYVKDTTTAGVGVLSTASTVPLSDVTPIATNTLVCNPTSGSAAPTTMSLGTTSGVMEYVNGSPDTLATFAAGSTRVPFGSGTNGQLTDSSTLIWDNTNTSLGIGVAPTQTLQIQRNVNAANAIFISNASTGAGAGTSMFWGDSNTFGGGDYLALQLFGTGVGALGPLLGGRTAYWYYGGSGGAARLLFQNGFTDTVFSVGTSPAGGVAALTIKQSGQIQFPFGDELLTAIASPSTPASGTAHIYVDATSKNLAVKNDAGTVNHGAQTKTNAAGVALTAIADDGSWTTQSFTAPGTPVTCSQLPALTGSDGIATAGGTCTVTNAYKGKVLVTGSDVTPDFLGSKVTSPTGTIAISTPSVGTLLGLDAKLTKHDYFIQIPSLQPADTANRFLATSFYTPQLTGLSGELPNDFIAGNIAIKLYLIASTGTATTYRCWSTLNGSVITGTQFTFTPGTTSPGVMAITAQPTGSASASDTFGEECVYDGNFVTGPFGATIAFSIQQVLSP